MRDDNSQQQFEQDEEQQLLDRMTISQSKVQELFEYREGCLFWTAKSGARSHIKIGQKAGGWASGGYETVSISGKRYFVHRIIYIYHHGVMPKYVDHINGKKNDNRIENLRPANHSENMCNAGIYKNNSTGIKGVFKRSSSDMYFVQVRKNNKNYYLGSYEDLELAELVAIEGRNKLHGLFARHI